MYFLLWDEITETIIGAFRSLLLSLCEIVYGLIIFCFNIFEKISTARLLDSDTVNMLYEKVGLILGIYMIFRLTFVAIKYVLNPDDMIDKQKGASKLLMKAIIVLVLLGTTPFIFNLAYALQTTIAKENVIGKIILNSNEDTSDFGGELSWYLFSAFYKQSEELSGTNNCPELDVGLIEVDLKKNSSLKYAYDCINDSATYKDPENGSVETYIINFNGVLALAVGIAVLWIIVMYTISVGFRLIQLAFLELIAPLPIMMYLEPKDDGPFQKWVKLCISSYLDYFIRTAIIYFICFLVKEIMDMDTSYFFQTLGGNTTDDEYRYIVIIVIFGLLTFAKKLPELLKEIMPSSGAGFNDYGFSFKKRTDNMVGGKQIYGVASTIGRAGTVGLVGAAATGAVGLLGGRGLGRLTGLLGGAGRGLIGGSKGGSILNNLSGSIKKQSDINSKKIDWANSGSTWNGRMRQRFDNAFGRIGEAERYDNEIQAIDYEIEQAQSDISTERRQSKAYQEVSSTKSKMLARALDKLENGVFKTGDSRLSLQEKLLEAKSKLQYLQQNGGSEDEIRDAQVRFNQVSKETSESYVDMVVNGSFTGDAAMTGLATHIRNLVADDRDGAFVGLNGNITSFADLDSFEGAVSGRNAQVGEEIARVERGIQIAEDCKKAITSSDEFRSANANRNAVGGHKGNNR